MSLFVLPACAQQTGVLKTQDGTYEFRAGLHAPQLVRFGSHASRQWTNTQPEQLPGHVWRDGVRDPLAWQFNRERSISEPRRLCFIYESAAPKLRLEWEWVTPAASGPLIHTIRIQNLEKTELWMPLENSFTFHITASAAQAFTHFYVEKGAGHPSAEGTHRDAMPVGYDVTNTSSTYAHPQPGERREMIPFSAVLDAAHAHGWFGGIVFSGRTRVTVTRSAQEISGAMGLDPEPAEYRRRLAVQETFALPRVVFGAFTGDTDDLGNLLRPWVRQVFGNARSWSDAAYPLLVNNSWGSGMAVNDAIARGMIADSQELGMEMFHLDAGWFRGVGDWHADPAKFPHGIGVIADAAHKAGLKFGLWMDWTQAGISDLSGALNLRQPLVHGWTVSDVPAGWKPQPFKGQTIDIGVPAAQEYAQREVLRVIGQNHLDMLEHDGYLVAQGCVRTDHPHASPDARQMTVQENDGNFIVRSSNSTDVSERATNAYYQVQDAVRRRYPNVLLEICNDGGRMVDLGSAAHGDYFSITDAYDPVSNRQAFYDASHILPAAMLETYVEKWPVASIENFLYMLRSGMQGWLTIMQDTTRWTPEQHAAAKRQFELYKKRLRPLIRDGDLYHVSERPDGVHWDGVEYKLQRDGVLYAFRGSGSEEQHVYHLRGVKAERRYRLRFEDHPEANRLLRGDELQHAGLPVVLPHPNSSELVFFEEVPE